MAVQTGNAEKSRHFLEAAVKDYKIFVDTCSLLFEEADLFWANIIPILEREKKSVIIPYRVYQEVDKFASDKALCAKRHPDDPKFNSHAAKVKKDIVTMKAAGLVEVYGDTTDNFADNVFLTVFTQYRLKYNLMLVTQDNNLANDIMNLDNSRSVNTKNRIMVEKINRHGFLRMFKTAAPVPKPQRPAPGNGANPTPRRKDSVGVPDEERFAFAASVTQVEGKITASHIPGEGDEVTAERGGQKKPVKLVKAGPSGGEGTIYFTDIPNVVAKIYKREKIDKVKFEKIKLMLTKNIECEGVCFPIACVYNKKNQFVGYLMNKAQGKELQKCVFIPPLLKKTFPDWKKNDTVELCVTILKKIKYLHDRNVILGDINPNNILVVSPKEVYFVDTDSYQIEGYPCPVGTINFTAPEIQRKRFNEFLRTVGNERFAVATLLFMIMLPGKPPYSMQGGVDQIDNIINMDFAYASGEKTTGKAPEGMWRFCWSHLPRYLKDDFYQTFRKDGEHSTEQTRYSTGDWLQKFENYMYLLTSGKYAEQDEMSLELFPTRLKKNPKATYVTCKLCGSEVDEDKTQQGYCYSCLKKGETYQCASCGCEMLYSNYQKLIKHSRKHELCKNCNDKKNEVYTRVNCSNCGSAFEITCGQKEFFESKGFPLPKKCPHCRGNRSNNVPPPHPTGNSPQPASTTTNSGGGGGGWCFITTAVCEYLHKPDDCYELTTLRAFRDGWLVNQPNGDEIVKEYYRLAPQIVEQLEQSDEKDLVYGELLDYYIAPCIKLIELNAYEACRDLYTEMVNKLKQKLL